MTKIASIDVDLTVVDIGKSWLAWLNAMTQQNLTLADCFYDYDLGHHFKDQFKAFNMSPYDYFRQDGLYDMLTPIEGSVEALRWLKLEGYDIVFTSHIKGRHNKSKYTFLKRFFPFLDGYVATKEKYYVKHDILIDDRNKNLNKTDKDSVPIKYCTPYSQETKLLLPCLHLKHWELFPEVFTSFMENK